MWNDAAGPAAAPVFRRDEPRDEILAGAAGVSLSIAARRRSCRLHPSDRIPLARPRISGDTPVPWTFLVPRSRATVRLVACGLCVGLAGVLASGSAHAQTPDPRVGLK